MKLRCLSPRAFTAKAGLCEAVRDDVLTRVRDDLQRGSVFYDLHHQEPYRLDVFSAVIKDGRGNVLHRRLFAVQTDQNHAVTLSTR